MENTIFSGEIKRYIAAASAYKCIPDSICEELMNEAAQPEQKRSA